MVHGFVNAIDPSNGCLGANGGGHFLSNIGVSSLERMNSGISKFSSFLIRDILFHLNSDNHEKRPCGLHRSWNTLPCFCNRNPHGPPVSIGSRQFYSSIVPYRGRISDIQNTEWDLVCTDQLEHCMGQ